jgi:hypothetical protein
VLSRPEHKRLHSLEQTVAQGLETFLEVGLALAAIRDERLYRERHARFADYLRERWQLSRGRAYQLIDAARVC